VKKILIVLLALGSISIGYFLVKNNFLINKNKIFIEKSAISPTPTPVGGSMGGISSSPGLTKCEGLSGELEMQVLVGPAEAVGMSPVTVGDIPFSVIKTDDAYLVKGEGSVSYQETMGQAWGTYSVSLEMDATVEGECVNLPENEALNIVVISTGEQLVEVDAAGFQGSYPWSGTRTLDLNFPLEDGAQVEGEGWSFILHLSN
jgi:hypothetical protein